MRTLYFLALYPVLMGCGSNTVEPTTASSSTGTPTMDGGQDAGVDAGPPAPTTEQILAAKWQKLASAPKTNGKQDDVYFVDPEAGWSINGLGQIFQTKDGGGTWNKVLEQKGTYFRAVTFLDEKRGFASNIGTDYYPGVTDETPLYETSDGGGTWAKVTKINGPTPKGICNFSKLDDKNIIATGRVGGPSFFLKSSDAGASWTSKDITKSIAMLVDSHFSTPDDGFVTGGSTTAANSHCVIVHTADGGATWETAFKSKGAGEMCWKFSFPSEKVGYASVLTFGDTPSTFIKTVDGGKTWEELPLVEGSYAGLGIGFITEDIGWIAGEASPKPAYRTKDGGKTWEADPSLGHYINRFRFVGDRTGYAIGSTVYKLEIQ